MSKKINFQFLISYLGLIPYVLIFLDKYYFLIVEGIFAKEFSNTLNNKDYIYLEIKTKKNECMKRVVKRDIKERGKDKKQAEKDFLKSWSIYYKKFKPSSIKKNTNKFIIEKNTDIDHILKKLFN